MELLTTLFAGGATGILGSIFGKAFGLIDKWQERLTQREAFKHELRLLDLQHKSKQYELEHQMEKANLETMSDIRQASYQHDSGSGQGSQWVVNTLRLIRPILTVLLLIGVAVIWFTIPSASVLQHDITQFIVYATMTAITWWFGDRAPKR